MNNLTIELEKIENKKDIRLKRLLQLYQYDWSEITNTGILSSKGLYRHINLNKFWKYPESTAFLIRVSDEIAGFVMIKKHSYLVSEKAAMCIAEFFIMRKFRRQKIGTEVATKIFNIFPGRWQIAETASNKNAQEFWKKVIVAFTNDNYKEVISESKRWEGPVQIFKSPD